MTLTDKYNSLMPDIAALEAERDDLRRRLDNAGSQLSAAGAVVVQKDLLIQEQAETIAALRKQLEPPVVTPPTTEKPGTLPARKTLDGTGKGTPLLKVLRNESRTFADFHAQNIQGSLFESDMFEGVSLIFRNIKTDKTPRYSIYVGAKDKNLVPIVDRAAVKVLVEDFDAGEGQAEANLRFVEGTDVVFRRVTSTNGPDRKNECCARWHGFRTTVYDSTIGNFKAGPQEDGDDPTKNRNPNSVTEYARFYNTNFIDGGRITKGVREFTMIGGSIDVTNEPFNKHIGGNVNDVRTKVLLDGVKITGPRSNINLPNCDVTYRNVTLNGKPFNG